MIKLSIKTVPVILMAALLSGCASDLMKATPVYSGKLVYGVAKSGEHVRWNDPEAEKIEEADVSKNLTMLDAERVNVWPLVYYNFPVTSIFWPFAEINDKGWAARPFIMANDYEKNYYYMMWLGNIDNKNESSYFIPAYYKSKDSFVSLPCFWTKNTLGVMPPLFFIGNRVNNPTYNFMFPFAQYTPSDNSSYVFPLYSWSDKSFFSMLGGWSDKSMLIAPPLFAMTNRDRQPTYHIMFPFGKYNTATGTSYALPLYYKSKDICVLPLGGWNDKNMLIVPPLFAMTDRNTQPAYHIMFPFGKYDTATGTNYALPLYYKSNDLFFCMLGGWSDKNMLIVPPLFAMTDRNTQPAYHIMFPFGKYDTATGVNYAFPLYYSDNESFYTMLTGWEKNKFFYAGGPLCWVNTEKENVYNVMWPMVRTCPAKSEYRFLPIMDYKAVPGGYDLMYMMLMGGAWKNEDYHGSYFLPLYLYQEDKNSKMDSLITPLFGSYDKGDGLYVLPPFYFRNRYPKCVFGESERIDSAPWKYREIGYTDNNIFFPFGKLRVMHEPPANIPEYQGHAFMFYGRYKDDLHDKRFIMWPFYGSSENYCMKDVRSKEEKEQRDSTPRLERSLVNETIYSIPFYYYERTPDSLLHRYFVVAGSKHEKIAGEEHDSYYAAPFYANIWREKWELVPDEKDENKLADKVYAENVKWYFPLLLTKDIPEKKESKEVALPFFYIHEKTPEKESHFVFPALYTRNENFKNNSVVSQAFWSMLFYYKNEDGNTYRNYGMFTGNMHEKIAGKDRDSFYILPFYLDTWKEVAEDSEFEEAMRKYGKATPSWKCSSRHLRYYFPFVATTEYPEKDEFNFTVLPFFYFYSSTPEEKSNSAFLWFFTRNENLKKKSIMSQAMWFLFYYKDQQKTETEEAFTTLRVFGKLYHREKSDNGVNVDVFPFIKYAERNKEKNERGYSFAWRLFNIKNDDDGLKRLDIFFIPFYSKGKTEDGK